MSTPLVSVIVPAYNAESTIAATLASICGQTYPHLEIIVVDDGSTDSTAMQVESMAALDTRIQLFRQTNRGVAFARNLAIEQSRGELIAPIDADDLWSPVKIEKQVKRLLLEPPTCVLVYNWSYHIDCEGSVIGRTHLSHSVGRERELLCKYNIVGNGSTPLMRKSAVVECGGYDCTMQEMNAHGCEDYKLYLDLSRCGPFSAIDEYLTGYRIHSDNMSSNLSRMLKSRRLAFRDFLRAHPEYMDKVREGEAEWLIHKALTDLSHLRFSRLFPIMAGFRDVKWISVFGAIRAIRRKHASRSQRIDLSAQNVEFCNIQEPSRRLGSAG